MKIFMVATSLASAYGGPARSVSALALALADAGLEVGIWAADGSADGTPFLPVGSALHRLPGDLESAMDIFKPDIVHDNGIWMPHNHGVAKLASRRKLPRVVSTRGMLEPWAMNHRKWKKRFAWMLYQRRDLQTATLHHATASSEATNISRLNLSVPVSVIPNGVELPSLVKATHPDTSTGRTALFVGRLHPVKGLSMLIEAWSMVRPAGWKMKIVGPDEDGHKADLREQIENAGLAAHFEFTGQLDGSAIYRAYTEGELFILPSHSENFGMAIGEALAHGLPVITTHGAPWPLLETGKCGWWTPINSAGIAKALSEATALTPESLQEMGARGRKLVAAQFAWPAIARDFRNLYDGILGNHRPGNR